MESEFIHEVWLEENFAFKPLPEDFELPSLIQLASIETR